MHLIFSEHVLQTSFSYRNAFHAYVLFNRTILTLILCVVRNGFLYALVAVVAYCFALLTNFFEPLLKQTFLEPPPYQREALITAISSLRKIQRVKK